MSTFIYLFFLTWKKSKYRVFTNLKNCSVGVASVVIPITMWSKSCVSEEGICLNVPVRKCAY